MNTKSPVPGRGPVTETIYPQVSESIDNFVSLWKSLLWKPNHGDPQSFCLWTQYLRLIFTLVSVLCLLLAGLFTLPVYVGIMLYDKIAAVRHVSSFASLTERAKPFYFQSFPATNAIG